MQGLREKIRFRFAHVDTDGDGVVSFAELKSGFNHESVSAGENILREMLAACAAGDREATSCTQEQMEQALFEWVGSRSAITSLTLLRADPQHGFRTVSTQEIEESGPCGPSAGTPDRGLEGVKCTMQGAMCFTSDVLLAWSLNSVCQDRTCICEATPETKRLAKLGLMGAAGVSSAKNFSDPGDEVLMPSCGNNWSAFKVVGIIDDVDKFMTDNEVAHVKMALPHLSPLASLFWNLARTLETEVALYKSAQHRLSKSGAYGKVCMMSWQATRDGADMKANLMFNSVPFPFAKPGVRVMVPKGMVLAYASTRGKLKRLFEQECCNAEFQTDKVVISGHSRGGSLAELHAMDVAANWECPRGRDLGARELAVVLVAPLPRMFAHNVVNQLWSCNDTRSCLAGSVVTIVTKGDYAGDLKTTNVSSNNSAGHPSEVARLPCPPVPEGANYNNSVDLFSEHWCHGMYNYVPLVEQKLVGEARWGSSCDGACGDPNRVVQCNQWVVMADTGCSYACSTTKEAFPRWLSPALQLPAATSKIEFKILVQPPNCKQPEKIRWESGSNHVVELAAAGGKMNICVSCKWGKKEVRLKLGAAGAKAEAAPAEDAGVSRMPRVDTAVHWGLQAPEGGGEDTVGEQRPPSQRLHSARQHDREGLPQQGSWDGMLRRSSRHMIFNANGTPNIEMSRNPSMMLLDPAALQEDCAKHEKELEQKEREQLNRMQRRIQSGSLLEEMRKITDFADPSKTVMLQGFNWESWRAGGGDWYGIVGSKTDLMVEMGITDIWLPPCSASVAAQGYLPSQLFNLDGSKYGSQASLEALLEKLHDNGIRGVADIVINHRCGDQQDSQGRWNQFTSGMTSRPSFAGVMDWGGWAITLGDRFSDGTGLHAPDSYDGKFDAAPDIDHKNEKVQQSISIWLRWLRLQVGFDAWRFDFVKGYAAEYVGHYCRKSEPAWAVGELWGDMQYDHNGLCHNQDRHRQDLCNWINFTGKASTAFDFTTKGILQEAVRNCQYWRLRDNNGKPPGLIGWWPKFAVTFLDNHDTGSTQRHWPFPDDKVLVGYAYILTHPGIPCLFWDHVMDWGEDHRRKITTLLKARRESGIPVDAPVKIHCADGDLYLAEVGNPPALRVALGPRHPGDADRGYWSECASGRDYRVWVHRQPVKEEPPKAPPAQAQAAKAKAREPLVSPAKAAPAQAQDSSKQKEAVNRGDFAEQFGQVAAGQVQAQSPPPLAVDGASLTREALQAMEVPDLERLSSRLDEALKATNEALRSKRAGGS